MEQEPVQGNAGEMMLLGLVEHADRIGKSAQGTQHALAEQIAELARLRQWAADAAVELDKRATARAVALKQQVEAIIKSLEAERAQMQAARVGFERSVAKAIHDAVRQQSGEVERQTAQALAAPLQDIGQAAAQVRQNIKDSNWLYVGGMFFVGLMLGLFAGYYFIIRTQNTMDDRLDRIEQVLPAPAPPVPAQSDPQATDHKGK